MADTFEAAPQKSAEAVPVVPPSTSEVSMRTMQSDLSLMGQSGGGAPMADITRVSMPADNSPATGPLGVPMPGAAAPAAGAKPEARWMKPLIWTLVILAGAGILFGIGFYVVPLFLK